MHISLWLSCSWDSTYYIWADCCHSSGQLICSGAARLYLQLSFPCGSPALPQATAESLKQDEVVCSLQGQQYDKITKNENRKLS